MEKKSIKDALKTILEIQSLDSQMLSLMRVKQKHKKEREDIDSLRKELHNHIGDREKEIDSLNKQIQAFEQKIQEIGEKVKKLEAHQSSVKKADEYQALTQEMASLERERLMTEQKASELTESRVKQEEAVQQARESLQASEAPTLTHIQEIEDKLRTINEEGQALMRQRDSLAKSADSELLQIYERLFRNKKDQVIVPLENRTCSGCHIAVTAQHESLVRQGTNLVFCEHCSRIHYWYEQEVAETDATSTKRRRRRMVGA